jgi:hypothetical protein
MARRGYKRRKVVVDRKMQIGLSVTVIVVLSCYLLLFCLIAVYSPFATLLTGAATEERLIHATNQIAYFVKHFLLPIGLTFACLALHCVLLTHRIAGPAYRFRKTFESARERDLSVDIHLRRGDYMTDLAEVYNGMMGGIRRDLAEARKEVAALAEAARDVAVRTAGPSAERATEIVERSGRLEGLLGAYRLEPEPEAPAAAEQPEGEAEPEPAETPTA